MKIHFYDVLSKTLKTLPLTDNVIIAGDLNFCVGSNSHIEEWQSVLGDYAKNQTNKNGQMLMDFCVTHNFHIVNSFCSRGNIGSWRHTRSKVWHQLDHILYRGNLHNKIQFCFVDKTADSATDHRLLKMKLFLNKKKSMEGK